MATQESADAPLVFDAAIVGAGPAGCSCALWLAEYGLRPLLIDRQAAACTSLNALDFAQQAVLGSPGRTLAALGADYRAQLAARPDIAQRYGAAPIAFEQVGPALWRVQFADGSTASARSLVLATGLSPVRPAAYFNEALLPGALLDAVSLVRYEAGLSGHSVLLLGGGDNAGEHALTLAAQGNAVTISSRSPLHVQRRFADGLAANPSVQIRIGLPPPTLVRTPRGYRARWADASEAEFDAVAVLFGYAPNRELLALLPAGAGPHEGVFLAGDLSQRLHACVPCAVGDGANVAQQVERWLAARA